MPTPWVGNFEGEVAYPNLVPLRAILHGRIDIRRAILMLMPVKAINGGDPERMWRKKYKTRDRLTS